MRLNCLTTFIFLLVCHFSFAQIDLSNAAIWMEQNKKLSLNVPAEVLRNEVLKRTGFTLGSTEKPVEGQTVIFLVSSEGESKIPKYVRESVTKVKQPGQEGYKLVTIKDQAAVIISGKDARAVLFGVGKFLREAAMKKGVLAIKEDLAISSAPAYPIRGHQLGYRAKTNSYDAFTVAQFDQYIRDLALFGANSIEIMPPRTDDDDSSKHMVTTPFKMMMEQSRICKKYELDVWMWYPNMAEDYTKRETLRSEMSERLEVFAALPKLDHLFVPGGDPGDLEPDVLFKWLGTVSTAMRQYHPNAKIWVSPQAFKPNQKWFDDFFTHANAGYPWFGGIVFGPWVKIPLEELRTKLNPTIPIRLYPDITHSLSSQYPVPDWDVAYAMTLGRECINPRPYDQKLIHNRYAKMASGSISYSEGTNDDLNKFIWSDQDWDPATPVLTTLRDYARLFINPDMAEELALGIVALENNLKGDLLTNTTVGQTLLQWKAIERKATPDMIKNFRYQMCLLRAYYDAYVQRRLVHETAKETMARQILEDATAETSHLALLKAKQVLDDIEYERVGQSLKAKCFVLADSLYSSIGAQLTIEKHGAMPGRGNFLDNIDIPLTDAPWIYDQLTGIENIADDNERLQKIKEILTRTDPGPGGFYDHFGNTKSKYRVVSEKTYADDPSSLQSPRISFGVGVIGQEWVHEVKSQGFSGQVTPAAWMSQINTLYETPLKIHYDQLDTSASYKMRITYTGRFRSQVKLVANDKFVIHDFLQTGERPLYEFDIPKEATAAGTLNFTWTCGEGQRGSQVCEIWLIHK